MPSVQLDNHKHITYDDFGNGSPVIFIHPPGMGRLVFYRQRKLENKMRVIIPDLSGHGDSSRIDVEDISIKYYSEEIIALLDELKIEKAVFFGYSVGGAIALYISSHFHDRIKGVILSGGYPAVLNSVLQAEHKMGMYMVKNHRSILMKLLASSHTSNQEFRDLLINHMNKAQSVVWYRYYQEALHMDLINDIKQINTPLLAMYGTLSDPINKYSKFFKARIAEPHRIVFFKKSKHQLPTKRWKQVNKEIIQFIERLD